MLSGVLHSQQAVEVNVAIMRAFVRLREFLASQAKLGKKLREMERKVESHHESIHVLFEAIQQLTSERPPAIGFHIDTNSSGTKPEEVGMVKERHAEYRTARSGEAFAEPCDLSADLSGVALAKTEAIRVKGEAKIAKKGKIRKTK